MSFRPAPLVVDADGHLTRNSRPNPCLPAARFEDTVGVIHQYQADAAAAADAEAKFHADVLAKIRANPGMRIEEAERLVRVRTAKPFGGPVFDAGANKTVDLAEVVRINGV